MKKIEFNLENYQLLKLSYEKAVSENREQFVFENNILLTSYAKYLLQHLENELGIDPKNQKR
jgi:hypothetical protein